MKFAYLVHDLSDAAVYRRVRMFQIGGADLKLGGFCRGEPPIEVGGVVPMVLGRTKAAALGRRIGSVLLALVGLERLRCLVCDADVIIARNLEMLVIAAAARRRFAKTALLVYECLDIHRTMLGVGFKARAMRWLERRLLKLCDDLIVSSPAFLQNYFKMMQKYDGKTELVENKVVALIGANTKPATIKSPMLGAPWQIGWFGIIRCQRSLDILADLAVAMAGRIEVIIRGRPALHEFRDFYAQVASAPWVRFEGEYANPRDLQRIYGEVQFAWAVDFFEANLNSTWLLPNRIYEAGLHNVVAIADGSVETGRWLSGRGLGVVIHEIDANKLRAFFNDLDESHWQILATAAAAAPRSLFLADYMECRWLVDQLSKKLRSQQGISTYNDIHR